MTEYRLAPDPVIYVGMERISEVTHHASPLGVPTISPQFSNKDGKPGQLLVLDSTWDTLVYTLEKAQKERAKALLQSSMIVWALWYLFFELLQLAEVYLVPGMNLGILLSVLAVTVCIVAHMQEKLMTELLLGENDHVRQLFQRDGYQVTVERRKPKWPCAPRSVSLRFERIADA